MRSFEKISQIAKSYFDMAKNIKSNIVFCGLVSGYQGEGNTATPHNAAEAVAGALHKFGVNVLVAPAVCVYHTDWGCPQGGEPVGAFVMNAPVEKILQVCEDLRKELKQSTLSVSIPNHGSVTLGFTAQVKGNLLTVGAKWQEEAASKMLETGTYVSCGIADNADGSLTISAEANPEFVQDLESWGNIVRCICKKIGAKPQFDEAYFNYLR